MANDVSSLAHTRWNCKYHIVFAPKYRRKVFFGEKRVEIGKILRKLCEWKGIEIHEAEICPDHVHMLISIPPKVSVSSFMGYLKGKSSVLLYEQFGELQYKYRNREFWCRGYYVDTVGKNTKAIAEYIKHQLDEDKLLSLLAHAAPPLWLAVKSLPTGLMPCPVGVLLQFVRAGQAGTSNQ